MPKNDYIIDEDHLDREWVRQGDLMLTATEGEADARYEHAVLKAAFELMEAEVALEIRLHPEKFGLPKKTTEPMIKSRAVLDPRYQKAYRKMLRAKHTLDVNSGGVSATEHKKKGLEKLVDLLYLNYRSEPRAPADRHRREEFDEAGKRGARTPIKKKKRREA